MRTVKLSEEQITALRKLVEISTEILRRVDNGGERPKKSASAVRKELKTKKDWKEHFRKELK